MTQRRPLPPDLAGVPFRVTDAAAAGVSRSRLRARDLIAPARGVRAPATERPPEYQPSDEKPQRTEDPERTETFAKRAREEFIAGVQAFAPALLPDQFVSHETALTFVGAPLPRFPYTPSLHVSAHRPDGLPRRKEVIGHRLGARAAAAQTVRGVACEHPARAWRQTATLWQLDDLVAAGDFLIQPRNRLLTIADLHAEVQEMGDVRDRRLATALSLLRVGAESSEETRLRLTLQRAGLPEPDLQHEIFTSTGVHIARFDLAYPHYCVATEYDGRGHAASVQQFQRDADRWDGIRAAGWHHVRILNHHLRPDPQIAVRKVTEALLSAGWRPGQS